MNIVVTGGTGFVGQAVVRHYLRDHHHVFTTGREVPVPGAVHLGPDFQQIDFGQLPRIDILNHQAAVTDPQHPDREEVWRVNFLDSIDLFQRAVRHGVRRIVYASSAAVYGDTPPPHREAGPFKPLTAYGVSKLALDRLAPDLLPADVSVVGLRYSNVWGPGEAHKGKLSSMVGQVGRAMIRGERPRLFKFGEQRRDFVHVEDVARANVLAGEVVGREVFNIGQGSNLSFLALVDAWNHVLNKKLKPAWIDNPYHATYQAETLLDITKARLIGWQPQDHFVPVLREYRDHLHT